MTTAAGKSKTFASVALACLGLLCGATASEAQDFTIDAHLIDRCLGVSGDLPMACVGRQADACYIAYGGGADMVLAACQAAELAFWDEFLNESYATVIDLARAEQQNDVGYRPDQLTDAVRIMQRSWITYRDATCGVDAALAAPFGSAGGPAYTDCLMRETARQVFQLQSTAGKFRQ